jgi:hypothetical protein
MILYLPDLQFGGNHYINHKLCPSARLEAEALGEPFAEPCFPEFRDSAARFGYAAISTSFAA